MWHGLRDSLEVVVVGSLFLLLIGAVSSWCVKDSAKRGKDALWVWIAVFVFFSWGLIAWLIFRPKPLLGNLPMREANSESL